MNNRSTYILGGITGVILLIAIIAGAGISTKQTPQPSTVTPAQTQEQKRLSATELDTLLTTELPIITTVIQTDIPKVPDLYIIDRGALYQTGQWYGTTLTYKGTDSDNRDTLRILLQKKDGQWILRSKKPSLLLSVKEYPDVPKTILESINKPAPLPGAGESPAITPTE